MKKIAFALAVVFSLAGSLFAEGNSGPDFSAATTALTDVSTSLTSWVTGAMPILVGIAGAFLIFWLGRKVFRIIKSWAGSST